MSSWVRNGCENQEQRVAGVDHFNHEASGMRALRSKRALNSLQLP